jgi:hypothetical protein
MAFAISIEMFLETVLNSSVSVSLSMLHNPVTLIHFFLNLRTQMETFRWEEIVDVACIPFFRSHSWRVCPQCCVHSNLCRNLNSLTNDLGGVIRHLVTHNQNCTSYKLHNHEYDKWRSGTAQPVVPNRYIPDCPCKIASIYVLLPTSKIKMFLSVSKCCQFFDGASQTKCVIALYYTVLRSYEKASV